MPALLGFELCQKMKELLVSSEPVAYLDAAGSAALEARRESLGDTLRRPFAIQTDGAEVRWWTFAGGRINHTLKYALELTEGWKAIPDNFAVRVSGDGVSDGALRDAVGRMNSAGSWDDPVWMGELLARLPLYRLSKFQDALPDRLAVEMVGAYFLDPAGARRLVSQLEIG